MLVLLKYIISVILQKPVRTILILLTVCLAGGAVFASVSLSDTMIKTAATQWRSEYGYADIVVGAAPLDPTRYLDPYKAGVYDDSFSYTVCRLSSSAKVLDAEFVFFGYTLDTLVKMLPLPYQKAGNLMPFTGGKIIVSAKYAGEHGVRVGDVLTAILQGNRHQFTVAAICPQAGPFAYEKDTFAAIIPLDKMQACLGRLGKADKLYIGLKDPKQKSMMILRLSELYKGYTVSETYSVDHIRLQTNRSAVPFVFMSVLLGLMAVYVIYVIFQNITVERMPQMGIFEALGAGRPDTFAVILLEGAAYGFLGGILSIGTGMLILNLLANYLTQAEYAAAVSLDASPWHAGLAFLICPAISIAGGLLSLLKYKAISIVSLIKQIPAPKSASGRALPAWAFLMCAASVLVLCLWRSQSGLVAYVLLVAAIIVSFLMAAPYMYGAFTVLIKRLAGRAAWFVRTVSLSIQHQRGFLIGAAIISVIAATTTVIQTIQYSSEEGNRIYFGRFHYDLELSAGGLTKGRINLMKQLPGVTDVCENFYSGSVDVKGEDISIYRIHGINTRKAPLFMDYDLKSSRPDPFEALDGGKNILLTNTLGNIYKVRENDTVILKIYGYDGKYREVPYKVIGFFDDEYTKLGRYALISQNNFAEDFKAKTYSSLLFKTGDIKASSRAIENACRDTRFTLTTVDEMQSGAEEESRLTITAMEWISRLSAFTGIMGMLFIMMLSIKSRSGELSVYYAMGFEKSGISMMLLAEMLLSGTAGALLGCLMGALISFLALPSLIYSLQIAMSIHFHPAILLRAGVFGILICLASGLAGSISFHHTPVMGGLRNE